jgi:Uma2 family endonuclease
VVQPDVLFVAAERAHIVPDWVRGVPDFVIEVLSPTHAPRDRIVKRDLYAKNGVPEYWIVDAEERTIEVYRHVDGAYEPAGYFTGKGVLRSGVLPKLALPLPDVFR